MIHSLRAEIGPPKGRWEDWGTAPVLRFLRNHAHRALNAAVNAIERCPEGIHPQTHAYRAVRDALAEARSWAQDAYREKLEAYEEYQKKPTGKPPRKPEAPPIEKFDAGMMSAWSNLAFKQWKALRPAMLRGDARSPSYTYPAPIMVRAKEWTFSVEDDHLIIAARLQGGRKGGWHRLQLFPPRQTAKGSNDRSRGNGWWWDLVRKLQSGQATPGDLRITFRKQTKQDPYSRWIANIAMRLPDPAPKASPKVLAVHLGMTVPLCLWSDGGDHEHETIGNERELWARKRAYQERRRELQGLSRGRKHRADMGGKGHKHRNRKAEALGDQEKRWLKTRCQQWAAQVIRQARRWKCGIIAIGAYIEENPVKAARHTPDGDREYVEREVLFWRPYMLKEAIGWAARREGYRVIEVEEKGMSIRCARCGTSDGRNRESREKFRCLSCPNEDDAEVNAAKNLHMAALGNAVSAP